MSSYPKLRSALAVFGAALVSLALVACGDDKDKSSQKSSSSAPETLAITLGADGKLSGAQSVKSGVVKVSFTNQAKGKYDLQLAGVDGNHTAADVLKVLNSDGGPIPPWIHAPGGVATTDPGKTVSATQLVGAGKYYVVAEPDQNGKKPIAPLTVTGGAAQGTLPATAAKVSAFEYGFKTSGLKAGHQQIEFDNIGAQLHHAVFIPLKPGVTLAQAKTFFASNGKGVPPFDPKRPQFNTTVLENGAKQVTEGDFAAGKYALLCFVSDRAGGPPHFAKGMITEVDIP
jgi:hypothetical protein